MPGMGSATDSFLFGKKSKSLDQKVPHLRAYKLEMKDYELKISYSSGKHKTEEEGCQNYNGILISSRELYT